MSVRSRFTSPSLRSIAETNLHAICSILVNRTIDSRVKGIGNSIKLNQHLLYHACLGISHLKGVKQSKSQEESQEEKKLEARNGEYNTPVGYFKVLEDP